MNLQTIIEEFALTIKKLSEAGFFNEATLFLFVACLPLLRLVFFPAKCLLFLALSVIRRMGSLMFSAIRMLFF